MHFDILTLFPEFFDSIFAASILARAIKNRIVAINTVNIRDYAYDKHKIVDDYPYGGGPGMVMKPEPIYRAIAAAKEAAATKAWVISMSPQGQVLSQEKVMELARQEHLIIVCGHYEGIDERVNELCIDEEISLGDYILTGGELAAAVIVDSIVRLLPGALGDEESALQDSFSDGLLKYPQYTRPQEFMGLAVPDILLSGHHRHIAAWRRRQALKRTWEKRPDLLQDVPIDGEDREFLRHLQEKI